MKFFFRYNPIKKTRKNFVRKMTEESPFNILKKMNFN